MANVGVFQSSVWRRAINFYEFSFDWPLVDPFDWLQLLGGRIYLLAFNLRAGPMFINIVNKLIPGCRFPIIDFRFPIPPLRAIPSGLLNSNILLNLEDIFFQDPNDPCIPHSTDPHQWGGGESLVGFLLNNFMNEKKKILGDPAWYIIRRYILQT